MTDADHTSRGSAGLARTSEAARVRLRPWGARSGLLVEAPRKADEH